MIACTECGFQNHDQDSFCGSCGGFLEWTGKRVAPTVADEPEPAQVEPKGSLLRRIQTVLSLDVTSPGEAGPANGTTSARPGGPPSPSGGPPGAAGGPPRPAGGPPGAAGGPPRPAGGPPRPSGGPPGAAGGPPRPAGAPPGTSSGPPAAADEAASDAIAEPRAPAPTLAVAETVEAAVLVATPVERAAGTATVVARTITSSGSAIVGALEESSDEAETAPGSVAPVAPVKPSRPAPRKRPVRQPPSRKLEPGDLVCGACGEGNSPARNFCGRCGSTLADAEVVKHRWWQRLVPRRRRRAIVAGARPWQSKDGAQKTRRGGRLKRSYARLRPIVGVMILLAGLVVGLTPNLRERATAKVGDGTDWVMSRLQKQYSPVAPIDVQANAADLAHPETLAIDSNTITAWIAPASEPEPTLVVRFDEPFDLDQINLWNGAADGFKDRARIRDIHFVFDTGKTFDLAVADVPDQKTYDIDTGQGVREIEIHVLGTYASLASGDLAVSEIEFLFQT